MRTVHPYLNGVQHAIAYIPAYPRLNTALVLHLEPLPLFRGNRIRRHADYEESLASVDDDDVVGFCTVCIEEGPGTIRMNCVASARRGIGPVADITVGASGRANETAFRLR
jgi:hypothetical protein